MENLEWVQDRHNICVMAKFDEKVFEYKHHGVHGWCKGVNDEYLFC